MVNRSEARERAVHLFIEAEAKSQPINIVIEEQQVAPEKYVIELLTDYFSNEVYVNELISSNAKGWASDRLPTVDRAVLKMAVTELVRSMTSPTGTIISEAVTLCEKYSTEESPRFVNGVLSTISHKVRVDELNKLKGNTGDAK